MFGSCCGGTGGYQYQWVDLIPQQPSASGVTCNFPEEIVR